MLSMAKDSKCKAQWKDKGEILKDALCLLTAYETLNCAGTQFCKCGMRWRPMWD